MKPGAHRAVVGPSVSMPTTVDPAPTLPPLALTGVPGLDAILHGGLPTEEMHLVQGGAGTGKTTMALQFLRAGVAAGEPTLYVTLSQPEAHLARIARSHGWNIDDIVIHELAPGSVASRVAARQTILVTSDVELGEVVRELGAVVERVRPRRAVIDSITILQLLAGSPQRYHSEVITLRQMFIEHGCTVMAIADHPAGLEGGESPEVLFHPICGCVIHLLQQPRPYGDVRRGLRVIKARAMPHNGGYHDLQIQTDGLEIYPRLGAYRQRERAKPRPIPSGDAMLDRMLAGGLETGSTCLIVGPSGVGKSTTATLYACACAAAGQHAALYLFDERPETYVARSTGFGLPLAQAIEAGHASLEQIDPGEVSPGEFAQRIRTTIEQRGTKVVFIDSMVGYFAAMGAPNVLVTQLHELLTFVTRNDALLIMCGSQEGFMSIGAQESVDVSYLSDSIIAMTFFEARGELRRAIVVVKKKLGKHLTTIHELTMRDGVLRIEQPPLTGYGSLMVPRRVSLRDEGDGDLD